MDVLGVYPAQWGLLDATQSLGDIMEQCGRLEDAAAAFEECLQLERAARLEGHYIVRIDLTDVYTRMGIFERAIAVGLEAEELI